MPISFVAAGAFATGSNPAPAVPAGYAAGDLLLVFYTSDTATTAPSGWTALYQQGTGRQLSIFYKRSTSSESAPTFTVTDTSTRAVMLAYRGVNGFTPNGLAAANTGSSTSASTQSFTPNQPINPAFVVSVFAANNNNANTWTTPASTTLRASANTTAGGINGMLVVDESFSGTSTTARSTTLSNTNLWATFAIAFYEQRNLFWVGGTGSWTDTTKWALSSGGAGGNAPPVPTATITINSDTTTIDTNSGTGTITATLPTNNLLYAPGLTVTATQALTLNIVYDAAASNYGYLDATNVTLPSSGSFTLTVTGSENPTASFNGLGRGAGGLGVIGTLTANSTVIPVLNIQGSVTLGSNLTVSGQLNHNAGTFDTSSAGNYSISAERYYVASFSNAVRNLNLNASSVTFTGSGTTQTTYPYANFASANYTINGGTSTVTFTGAIPQIQATSLSLSFYNISFTNTAITSIPIISLSLTANNFSVTSRSSDGINNISSVGNITVNGTLTLGSSNTAVRRIRLASATTGTQITVTAAAVATLSDVDFRDINAAGAAIPWSGTRLGNCLNNANITFDAGKTVYWNLAGTQNWSSTGWATTNNGTPSANNFPLAQDTAVFTEAGAAGTVSIDAGWNIGTIQMADGVSNRTTAFTLTGSTGYTIYGSLTFFNNLNYAHSSSITFAGYGVTQNVNLAGKSIGTTFTASAATGSVVLQDNLTANGSVNLTIGTFNANGYNVTGTLFQSSNTSVRTLSMGSGTWTLSGTGTVWNCGTSTNFTLNASTSQINLTATSTTARTFDGGGLTYNNLNIGGTTGTSVLTINGVNTFNTLSSSKTVAHTVEFAANQTIATWSVTGSAGNVVTVDSNTAGTQRTLTITNKTTGIDYLAIQDINSANINPITFWAGANSTNTSNNRGIAFADGATNDAYVITSGTTWVAPSNWNSSNNQLHLFGGGGGGAGAGTTTNRAGGAGGGGGAYTRLSNVTLTPSSSYTIAIGSGGSGGAGGSTSTGGTGGNTTFNDGINTYTANGGSGGTINSVTPSSTGGNGGTAQTIAGLITAAFAGGRGGNGGTGSSITSIAGGGGAGAGGPNGTGGNGGNGTNTTTTGNLQAGGGGGNGGGTAGGNGIIVSFGGGAGGNNSLGTGGGAALTAAGAGNPGSAGGGGSGGTGATQLGGNGGSGIDVLGAVGGGGGAGGSTNITNTATAGLYGGGGGGGGGPVANNGGAGAQGVIIAVYVLQTILNESITENSSLADILSALGIFNSDNTENSNLADEETVQANFNSDNTENSNLADTETAQASFNSANTENSNLADTETAQASFNSANTENSNLADTETAQASFTGVNTENTTLADTESVQAAFNSVITEPTTVNDVSTISFIFSVSITEPSILAELQALTTNIINEAITEALAIGDSTDTANVIVVSIVEAQSSSESQSVFAIFNSITQDNFDAASIEAAQANLSAIAAENTTLQDSLAAQGVFSGIGVENVTVLDAQSTSASFNSAITEPVTIEDVQIVIKGFNSSITENTDLADTSSSVTAFSVVNTESMTVADSLAVQGIFASFISEATGISDLIVGYGWFRVVDAQTIVWNNVDDNQTVTWTNVSDTQTPNWVIVDDEQP